MADALVVHVVDDDPAVRDSLALLLQSAGMSVCVYDSAAALLSVASKLDAGCVLTDVRMPEIDGLTLQRQLVALNRHLVVVVMTGHADVLIAVQALKAGARDFLEKPFDDERLIGVVTEALVASQQARQVSEAAEWMVARLATLTPREREVLDRLVERKPNKTHCRSNSHEPRLIATAAERLGSDTTVKCVCPSGSPAWHARRSNRISLSAWDCHATFVVTPDTILQGRNRMILCFCGLPHGMSRRRLLAAATAALLLPAQSRAATASAGPADPALLADLVTANHILFDQGVVDGFGHVSVRHNNDYTHFLMARSMAPALVTAADIIEYDSNSEPIDANGRASYIERYIHGEIYRMRPDVHAVAHSHSQAVIPFADTQIALRPMNHIAAFLGTGTPVFDIRNVGGDGTDMLIRDNALGKALAQTLGPHTVALMRGHGSVAVGPTLKHVVYRAVYTEVDARTESEALSMGGKPEFLSPPEAAAATKTTDKLVERPWELWKRHAEQAR